MAGLDSGEELIPSLNDLLDIPQSDTAQGAYEAMDSATREKRLQETVAAIVTAAAKKRPLLLIVEDVHWASRALLSRLAGLAYSIRDVPVLLLMNSRIEGDPIDDQWQRDAGEISLTRIDLVGLPEEEAMRLASGYEDIDANLVKACIERAGGNPLFLEGLLQSAGESGSSESLPGNIQSVVLARLDQLPANHKSALQCASVLGQRFSLEALQFVSGQPEYSSDVVIGHYLVRPEADRLIFSHALIHEGIYGSLLHSRARQLHLKAAEWFSERDLTLYAQHLGRAGDDRAAAAYVAAARAEVSAFRHGDALGLVAEARELDMQSSVRVDAACLEGETLNELGSAETGTRRLQFSTRRGHKRH